MADPTSDPNLLEGIMTDADTRMAFRYLTAPPISEDDLKTLADAKMSPTALRRDPKVAHRLTDVVLHILDPKRFPWIVEDRDPQDGELRTATVASAALAAAQRVQTRRRNEAKSVQEKEVKQFLRDMGIAEVARRPISNWRDAPDPGQFCSECKLGSSRADMVVGLFDRRVLAIECKASNSEVNSFKRINHEAVGKARSWVADFGRNQLAPAAILTGVFNPDNLATAQNDGLALFWIHRLDDLQEFINATNK